MLREELKSVVNSHVTRAGSEIDKKKKKEKKISVLKYAHDLKEM